jgi:ubiquinone/menaquinone biosynthesis C-methylase UbiE
LGYKIVTDATFRKDLGHLTWDEVLRRQQDRASLVPAWLQALDVRPGMRVLDAGAGPGYVTEQVARCVGPTGLVLALDRAPEILPYLERLRGHAGLAWIRPLICDVTAMDLRDERIDAALVTMMLHHASNPVGLLGAVARWLAPGVRAVVAEFDPTGPCTSGPPREHRIAPAQVQGWCEQVGLACLAVKQQTDEHYMLLVERAGNGDPCLDVALPAGALTPCAVSSDAKPGAVEHGKGGVDVRP